MHRRIAVVTRDGVLVSDSDGNTWTSRVTSTGSKPECLALDGRRADRILVGTFSDGLWRSADGGHQFERVTADAIDPTAVTALATDPEDAEHLLLGTEPSQLYESEDGGEAWSRISGLSSVPSADEWSFPPRPDTHHVRWIEIDPTDPDRWYIGVEAGALVYTPDGGDTWHDRPPGSRRDNHTLATHPAEPGRVYSAAGDGYAESTDGGASWTQHHEGLDHRYVWGLAVDRGDPETVIVSAATGASDAHREPGEAYLYRKPENTAWERLETDGVPTGPTHRRAVLSAGPEAGEFVAATDTGVYRSTDGGQRWDPLDIEVGPLEGSLPRALQTVAIA